VQVAVREDRAFTTRSQTGSLFRHRTGEICHAYPFAIHGYCEWRLWAVASALTSAGSTVIEIGANIGTETVGYADMVFPGGKVVAFEPFPDNFRALRENLDLNRMDHVTALPYAVSNYLGKARFQRPKEKKNSGVGHLVVEDGQAGGAPNGTIEVECVTIDSLKDDLGPPDLIVMDTEGAELDILRGAGAYLEQYAPPMILEVIPSHLSRAGHDVNDLVSLLDDAGYSCFQIGRFGLHKVTANLEEHAGNWLCTHPSTTPAASVRKAHKRLITCGLLPCIRGINPITRKRR
jgi:FkbM family methyltransferase